MANGNEKLDLELSDVGSTLYPYQGHVPLLRGQEMNSVDCGVTNPHISVTMREQWNFCSTNGAKWSRFRIFFYIIVMVINTACIIYMLVNRYMPNSPLANHQGLIQDPDYFDNVKTESPHINDLPVFPDMELNNISKKYPDNFPLHINKPTRIQKSNQTIFLTMNNDSQEMDKIDWTEWKPQNVKKVAAVILKGKFSPKEIHHFRDIFTYAQIFYR